ncbi:leucine-rich repeat-containing protein 37A-like isoform X2 [Heterocephalus glaber]|uniref:Leucine-rich repeat-containing protein 37A-like isoform X2 n=1 Tax=Heterocephalus glaber TaxID=10181 RepID=A0AAX6S6V5_HETGA|nr:leucine-rich repeat-containing protein 37A-like isoform X2 [Heterocephalus glaber]
MGNVDGTLRKALQAWNNSTSTQLSIEPKTSSSQPSVAPWSGIMSDQLKFHDQSDVIDALSYMVPYLSEGNPEAVQSALLPLIARLFPNAFHGDNTDSLKKDIKKSSFIHESNKNKLEELYLLRNWLNVEIQKKMEEVKKEEDTVRGIQPTLLGPTLEPQISRTLGRALTQENSMAEALRGRRLHTVDRVLRGLKDTGKRLLQDRRKQQVRDREVTWPLAQAASGTPVPRSWSSVMRAPRPRNPARFSVLTEGQRAATPSSLVAPWLGRSPTSRAQPVVRSRAKDFTHSIRFLNHGRDRVLRVKATPPAWQSQKSRCLAGTLFPVSLGTAQANLRAQLTKGNARSGLTPAKRPGFRALRSLMDSPPGGFLSAPGDLHVSAADSASGSASMPTHITFPVLPSLGVVLETGLNHLLQPLIPDDNLRRLIIQVTSILKMDCAEPPAPPACAKLISKSRCLLMLLTEQREATVSQAQGEQQQLYSDPMVMEGTEAHGKQKGQQTPQTFREHVLESMYIDKCIIRALAALNVILIAVIIALCNRQLSAQKSQSGRSRGQKEPQRRG